MSLRMAYVTRRDDSAHFQFRMRVPKRHLTIARGRTVPFLFPEEDGWPSFTTTVKVGEEVKFSLRTTNERVAELRELSAREQLLRALEAFRSGPVSLSHHKIVALAGEVYRLLTSGHFEEPGTPGQWIAFKGINRAVAEGRLGNPPPIIVGKYEEEDVARELFGENLTAGINSLPPSSPAGALETRFGALADWVLQQKGIELDEEGRRRLLSFIPDATMHAATRLKRFARGDYGPDPGAERYPVFEAPIDRSLTTIVGRWERERKPSPSTLSTWRGVASSLRQHLGHEDMGRLQQSHVVAWKDALVARGLSAKTINEGYLAALKSWLSYEVKNGRLTSNVAAGVEALGPAPSRMQPYSDDEVGRILRLARAEEKAPLRWLPWLAALTGARIGELAQLWADRVKVVDGIHVVELRPAADGGTFKNEGSERTVPLHPALVKEGFVDFANAVGSGPLFYRRGSGDRTRKHASKGTTNRVAAWIRRKGFAEVRKAPNHAFRHWFKSACARHGVDAALADCIQGHARSSVADVYRHFDLRTMHDALARISVPVAEDNRVGDLTGTDEAHG